MTVVGRAIALAAAAAMLAAAPAFAQQNEATITPPGERMAVTPTGVNMGTGRYAYTQTDLGIGEDSETGGLALTRTTGATVPGHVNGFANFSHNWEIMIYERPVDIATSDYTGSAGPDLRAFVHFGGRSETFVNKAGEPNFLQVSNNWRTSLTYAGSGSARIYTFTATDGTIAVFRPIGSINGECSTFFRCAYVSHIVFPDGTRFDFSYDPGSPARLRAVTSNRGYALLFQYGSGADASHVVSACALNLAAQTIPPNQACPGNPLASTSYGYTTFESKRRLGSTVDAAGHTWSFGYARVDGTPRVSFTRPGEAAPWLTNSLTDWFDSEGAPIELVDRQDLADGGAWRYFWDFSPAVEGQTPQAAGGRYIDPANAVTEVEYGFPQRPAVQGPYPVNVGDVLWQITPGPTRIVDPLGRETQASYCEPGVVPNCLVTQLQRFTEPDGRETVLTYDGWSTRNVVRAERRAVPGSTQPNGQPWDPIVTTANFNCLNNILCNRPQWRRDANGRQTDFDWDPTHGGLLSETAPAVPVRQPDGSTVNVRPQTRHSYAPRQAWISNGAGGWVQAGPAISVRTSTSTCRTSAATGIPASPCDLAGDEVLTVYDYGPDSGPNNLLLRGQTVTSTDGEVATTLRTCYTYDARGRRIGETQPNANLPSCPAAQTEAEPFTSNQRYDAMGRVTGTIAPDPDGDANPLNHAAVRNSYDAAGRLIRVETGELDTWQSDSVAPANWIGFTVFTRLDTGYDSMGRKTRDSVREGTAGPVRGVTDYNYDTVGRLRCTAVRMNPAAFANPPTDACLPTTPGTEGPDRITLNVYDAAGQRLQLREGAGSGVEAAEATWRYNANGQVDTVIDGNGNRAELRYDGHARQARWTFPSTTRPAAFDDSTPQLALNTAGAVNADDYEEYTYDPNGNRLTRRTRREEVLTFQYDALNRMTVKVVPDRPGLDPVHTRDVHYGYDLRGLQTFARFGSVAGEGMSTAYDGFGRPTSSSINLAGIERMLEYAHDANGNRTRLEQPNGSFWTFDFDGLNRMTHIRESGATLLVTLRYNARHRLAQRTNNATAGPTGSSLTYDGLSRLASLNHDLGGTTRDVTWTYDYNAASGLSSSTRDNDAFAFPISNLNRSYDTNGLNQYREVSGIEHTYDANGNLMSDGAITYTYDVENRLVQASGAKNAILIYDPLGRLWRAQGTPTATFLHDGDELVAEYGGTGNLQRRYVHGASVDDPLIWYENNTRRYLHADHQGSIAVVAGANGDPVVTNTYDEYGRRGNTNQGRFQYTGQIWLPEVGLYYYKARMYSPTLGRFMQVDPVGYEDQVNLYAYGAGDPVNRIDPTGTSFACPPHIQFLRIMCNQEPGEKFADAAENISYLIQHRGADSEEEAGELANRRATHLRGLGRPEYAQVVINDDLRSRRQWLVNPFQIHATQRTVSAEFSTGGRVRDTADDLRHGRVSPRDIVPIRVFRDEAGRWASLDNRRLTAARLAGRPILVVRATPSEIDRTRPRRDGVFAETPRIRGE